MDLAHDVARVTVALAHGRNPDSDPETAAALRRLGAHVACCDGCASAGVCDPYGAATTPATAKKKKGGR